MSTKYVKFNYQQIPNFKYKVTLALGKYHFQTKKIENNYYTILSSTNAEFINDNIVGEWLMEYTISIVPPMECINIWFSEKEDAAKFTIFIGNTANRIL